MPARWPWPTTRHMQSGVSGSWIKTPARRANAPGFAHHGDAPRERKGIAETANHQARGRSITIRVDRKLRSVFRGSGRSRYARGLQLLLQRGDLGVALLQ